MVITIDATPDIIVAKPNKHSLHIQEEEYLIDPRMLREVQEVEIRLDDDE